MVHTTGTVKGKTLEQRFIEHSSLAEEYNQALAELDAFGKKQVTAQESQLEKLRRMRQDYHDLVIESFGTKQTTAYMKKLEAKDIELQVAEAKVKIGTERALTGSELDSLIEEVQDEWNVQTPEDRAVFQEAETMARTQIERDTARALESLQPKKKFTTPRQKVRPPRETYQDYQPPEPVGPVREPSPDIDLEDSHALETLETDPRRLRLSSMSTKLDPKTGVLTGTTWEGDLVSHPMADSSGVSIRKEYEPPEADLHMGGDVEMQVLRRSGGTQTWARDDSGYTWMTPTDAEIQEELVLIEEAYGTQGVSRYHSISDQLDEKLETVEAEEAELGFLQTDRHVLRGRMQPETELTRTRVDLSRPGGSGSYEQLDDGRTVWLERRDRVVRAEGHKDRLRKLEAEREALRKRRSELDALEQERFEEGPQLGGNLEESINGLEPAERRALALELAESGASVSTLTTGEMMLKFGKTIGENALAMGALVALGYAMPDKVNKGINVAMDAMAVAALVTGVDPAFAAIQGAMELGKELTEQAHRFRYNLSSDRDHGRSFGYVRDGAHWYPAFVKQHEKWHGGLGERGNDLDLVYGTHMTYVVLPDNTIEPHFEVPLGIRHIEASDKDIKKSFKRITGEDGLRDWYLLQPDEVDMIKRGGQNIVVPKKGFVVHKDDWSVYKVPPSKGDTGEAYLPAWWAVNLDLRRSLDYIKHWQIGSKSADMRSLQHDTGLDPSYALDQTEAMISRFDTDFKHAWPGDETYDVHEHWHGTKEGDTNQFLLHKLLSSQIVLLQKAQFMAAKEQGYAPETFETHSPDQILMPGPGGMLQTLKPPSFKRPTAQPWRNYVDFNKDLGVATDSKNLNEQLFKIMNYKDRTSKQRGYLGQKAIVRYLMSAIEDRGGADDLAQLLTTKHVAEHGRLNRVGDNEYDPEGFFGSARMQKYVPPWANHNEGALPDYVVSSLNPKHRALNEQISETIDSAISTDESSWAHSTGSGTKPVPMGGWHVKIHGIEANPSVEQALQTSSDPPKKVLKTKISSKEMREQWERKQKFAGPDAKKGEMRSMQAIREEFKKNGARNLNKWELLQMRKDEALRMQHERFSLGWSKELWEHYLKDHGGKTPKEVKGQGVYAGRRPKESDPTDRRDPWYLAQPEYHFDITVGRWVSKQREKAERLQGKKTKKVTFEKPTEKAVSKGAQKLEAHKKAQAIKKAEKKAKRVQKLADRDVRVVPETFSEYHNRNERDPNDPWFRSVQGIVWSAALQRWVDPTKLAVKPVAPVHVKPPVVTAIKPKRIVPVPKHEQHHLDPSDVKFAETHPGYVPIPRLSWNEDAVAKMEGRPVTSHAGVEKPPHEADVPQTAIKVN